MTPQFQPGDRVHISGISSAGANCEGLLGTYERPDINDFHVVRVDDHGRTRSFRAHQLTKLPAQNPKFPIDAKVRIIGYSYSGYTPHGLIGQIGTVRINTFTSADPEGYCYIIDGIGLNNLFREDELELAIDTYKEGDQVRILASSYPSSGEDPVGKVGTIKDTNWSLAHKNGGYNFVIKGVGRQDLYKLGEFELVEPKFKIGDRVVLTSDSDQDSYDDPEQDPVNFPGTVTKVDPEFVVVDWDKGSQDNVCWFKNQIGETIRLLADVQAERVAYTPPLNHDVIVLVTFCDDEKKTPKAYEYRAARHLGIQPGDVLAVDTPYGNNKHITVQDVYELDHQMFKGTLKHIKKRVRKGNPQTFVPMYQRDAFRDVQQEGRGLVGKRASALIVDDFAALETQVHQALENIDFILNSQSKDTNAMYKITKPTLVNGTDVKNVTDDNLIAMIDANAQALESLRKQNERVQTKVLEQRIAKLQRDTDELRALLDSRYVADETPTDRAE